MRSLVHRRARERSGRGLSSAVRAAVTSLLMLVLVPLASEATSAVHPSLAEFGGDFTLTDHNGEPFSLHDARGKVVLIYFGFTSCADVCPLTLAEMSAGMRALGPLSKQVQPLFISVDPKRDTPEILRQYLPYFHPAIIGLTGTEEEIEAVTRLYRAPAYAHKPDENGDYVVDHSSFVYVVDAGGTLVNLLRFQSGPERVANVVRALLAR